MMSPSNTLGGIAVELTDPVKQYLRESAAALRGFDRRHFLARTVRLLGRGGQRRAEREIGWNRVTLRKALREFDGGIRCADAFCLRGRPRAEEALPGLLDDIRAVVDGQSQADPTFATARLYTRLTAAEVRRQVALRRGIDAGLLPCPETFRRKIRLAGYSLRAVQKTRPKKRSRRPTPSSRG
jgi:DNA-binding protein Fis